MKKILSKPAIFSAILLVLLSILMFAQIKMPFNFYDEGFALTGAQRVSNGEAPYKDFWGIYPPGQFYTIAAVFKLFGSNTMTARVYDALVRILTVIAVWLIGRKTAGQWLAMLAALVTGLILASAGFYSYAVFPALALGLWSVWFWLKSLETGKLAWRAAAGLLLGLTCMYRWDIGVYAALGVTGAGALYQWHCGGGLPGPGEVPPHPLKRLVLAVWPPLQVLLFMLLAAGLGYGLAMLRSGPSYLIDQVFIFPTTLLHDQRVMAYPNFTDFNFKLDGPWMQFYIPLLALALVLAASSAGLARRAVVSPAGVMANQPGDYGALALSIFGFGLFNQALSRYDFIHVTPATIVMFLAVCSLAGRSLGWFKNRAMFYAAADLLVLMVLMYIPFSIKTLGQVTDAFGPWGCYSPLEKAACVFTDPSQTAAVEYIMTVTKPGEGIYVGLTRHDKVFVGDSGFYFLADRPPATRYHELHPGVINTQPVQEEVITELESVPVKWIVLADIWESNEPNGSSVSTGVVALDEFIVEHYRPVTAQGMYAIEVRR